MAWLHLLCPSTLLQHNKTNILAGFVEYNSKREIIFSIFLTLEVKSYLILINFWKIVRILMISEKSDLGTHSGVLNSKVLCTFQSLKHVKSLINESSSVSNLVLHLHQCLALEKPLDFPPVMVEGLWLWKKTSYISILYYTQKIMLFYLKILSVPDWKSCSIAGFVNLCKNAPTISLDCSSHLINLSY